MFKLLENISAYKMFKDVHLLSESSSYPSIILDNDHTIIDPYREITMSLRDSKQDIKLSNNIFLNKDCDEEVFFFIYNIDNYYHFIYDTLPYLITYFKLRENNPKLKLLMSYDSICRFVTEFLEILGITEDDIVFLDKNTQYKSIIVSDSYTYGNHPESPPNNEIWNLYSRIVNSVKTKSSPKKLYISRRSWIHGDDSNIGTNYTTRRKMENEDELIEFLTKSGYEETFPELMTAEEKVSIFANAESIIGAIGGGMCNALFTNPDCKILTIVSPTFLDVNARFKYCLKNSDFFYDTFHTETSEFKKYMRVKFDNLIGEITDIDGDFLTISYSDEKVTGWNNKVKYKTIIKKSSECVKLDNGLNSSWKVNLEKFKNEFKI